MRISDWSSDVCSSDLPGYRVEAAGVLDVEAALAAVFRRRPQRALERVADAAVAAERVGDGDARDGGGRVFQGHNVSRFRPDGDPGVAVQRARLMVAELHVQADRSEAHRDAAVVLQAQEIGRASCRERVCQYV